LFPVVVVVVDVYDDVVVVFDAVGGGVE